MPYIAQWHRAAVRNDGPITIGDLNFVLTEKAIDEIKRVGGLSYATVNRIVGALDNAIEAFSVRMIRAQDSELTQWFYGAMSDYYNGIAGSAKFENFAEVRDDIVGAARCCQLELYRRVAAPYEENKIDENGDVYPMNLAPRLNVRLGDVHLGDFLPEKQPEEDELYALASELQNCTTPPLLMSEAREVARTAIRWMRK